MAVGGAAAILPSEAAAACRRAATLEASTGVAGCAVRMLKLWN